MKRNKILIIILAITIMVLVSVTAIAASVEPIEMPGNDIPNQDDITPPGCVFYSFEDNSAPGTYTVEFNLSGEVEPGGPLVFTNTIGTAPGNEYTELLSWSANFPVYAVTVKGGPNYNLYIYDTATNDTNLVSPTVGSGDPADVSHTSLIFCPPFMPTPTPTPMPTSTPTPPPPPNGGIDICICLIWIAIAIISFILGILVICCIKKCRKKKHHNPCFKDNDFCK
jgi:hypothetical protein